MLSTEGCEANSGCAGPLPPWRRLDRNRGRPAAAALFAHCRSSSPTNTTGVCVTAQPVYGQPGGLPIDRLSRRQGGDGPAQPDTVAESKDP